MNESDILNSIEEEMLSVIQRVDELIEEGFLSSEIDTEQYLKFSQEIQTYAAKSRRIIALLRTHSTHGISKLPIIDSP